MSIKQRDATVLKALRKGLTLREIDGKFGIAKSTAYDIGARNGIFSVRSARS